MVHLAGQECVHIRVMNVMCCDTWMGEFDDEVINEFARIGNVQCPSAHAAHLTHCYSVMRWAKTSVLELLIAPRGWNAQWVASRNKFLGKIRDRGFKLYPDLEALKRVAALALICRDAVMAHYMFQSLRSLYTALSPMTRLFNDGVFKQRLLAWDGARDTQYRRHIVSRIWFTARMRRFYPEVVRMELGDIDIACLRPSDIDWLAEQGVPVSLLMGRVWCTSLQTTVCERVCYHARLSWKTRGTLQRLGRDIAWARHALFAVPVLLDLVADYCVVDDAEVAATAEVALSMQGTGMRKRSRSEFESAR